VVIGGGELLPYQDNIIGAIGVSGATCEDDTLLGEYGKSAFKEMLACQLMKT